MVVLFLAHNFLKFAHTDKEKGLIENMLKHLNCFIFSKFIFTLLQIIVQIVLIIWLLLYFQEYILWILLCTYLLNLIFSFIIVNKNDSLSYQIAWLLLLYLAPIIGLLLYVETHLSYKMSKIRRRLTTSHQKMQKLYHLNHQTNKFLKNEDLSFFQLTEYLYNVVDFPVYQNTMTRYYSFGEEQWKDMLHDLKSAKHFIFLEYFTIEQGLMWEEILNILKEKVKENVEVRIMYDGVSSMLYLPYQYKKKLSKLGIKVKIFSPISYIFSSVINYRDHRKICVIDNKIAYTGGANIGDSYINVEKKKGIWKDNGVRLEGDAVKSFTLLYLEMWNDLKDNVERYIQKKSDFKHQSMGYVLPFGDNPYDHVALGKKLYLDLFYQAKTSIKIMSPYLVLDYEILDTLLFLSKKGIKISIFLPGIPDKNTIYWLGKTYYEKLIQNGIQIFEYTKGFLHAKTILIDQEKAIISTINLDYRSFYLQFECGCLFFDDAILKDLMMDFVYTEQECRLISLEEAKNQKWYVKIIGNLYRIFSPFY